MTAHIGVSVRTNKEVARSMAVVGAAVIAVAVVLSFFDNSIAEFYTNGGAPGWLRDFVIHVWSVIVQLAYPLGSFLIVGAIIVNRLPERPQASAE